VNRRSLRRTAVGLLVGAALVAVVLGLLFLVVRDLLVEQVGDANDNTLWGIAQVEVDLLRVVADAQRYAAGDPAMPIEALRERVDVFFSRVANAQTGDQGRFLAQLPDYPAVMGGLRSYLASIDRLLEPDEPAPAAGRDIAGQGLALLGGVHDFALAATHFANDARAASRRRVLGLVEMLAAGFFVMLATVIGGIVMGLRLYRRGIQQRLNDLTDSIPGAVFQLQVRENGAMHHLFASRRFAEIRGYDARQVRAADAGPEAALPLVVAEDRDAVYGALRSIRADLAPIDLDFRIDHPAGGQRWLNLRAAGRRDDDEGLVISGVFLDVSDKKAQAQALEDAKAQAELSALWLEDTNHELEGERLKAEAATQAKSSFLAMMSHEIRTPMNGVTTMAEMLEQTDLTEDQRGMTRIIRSSSVALLTIINDILDFSKIEAGKLDIEAIAYDLAETVEGVGELLAQRADDKGLAFVVDLDPGLPAAVVGDPTRVRQILLNLAGNAIKFTEVGAVVVRVSIAAGPKGPMLHFAVRDTGIGLTPEQRDRLFKPFQQADNSTSRRFGGTGLGLTISLKLTEMMGGAIGCTSWAGEGSTFWFDLPLVAAGDGAAARPEPAIDDGAVFAVGADGDRLAALAHALAPAGILPTAVEADEAALRAAVTARPDAVIVVFATATAAPELLLATGLAADPAFARARFVLAMPRALASTLGHATRQGIFATTTLPVQRAVLWRVIAAALGRAELDQRSGGVEVVHAPPPIEEARAAGVLILVAEDNATNQLVISRLLDRHGYAHEMAGDGVQALAKWRAGHYGLLLTDFHMPEMDGFELTRAIRAAEAETGADPRLPIVALTADALPGTRALCLETGMDDYLTKPVDRKALVAVLQRFLPGAEGLRRKAAAATPPAPAVSEIDPEIFELTRFRETFGTLDAESLGFLASFLASVPGTIAALEAALRAADLAEARHVAHALKGSARSIGAARLGQIASDLQDMLDAADADSAELLASVLAPTYDELVDALAPMLAAHGIARPE